MKRLAWLMFLTLAPAQGQGFEELGGFKSPSGNIHCFAYRDRAANRAELRCDVLDNRAKLPPRPKDCQLDWGSAFGMGERGRPERGCVGDTVADPKLPTLAYGKAWSAGGFRCDVTRARVRCVNRDGRGFELSRAAQRLF